MNDATGLTLLAVGDIGPDREDASELFELNAALLHEADLTFGQLEFVLSEKGERLPQVRHTVQSRSEHAASLAKSGFDVISFAGNHCLDFGASAMLDTVENLENAGLQVVGVGSDLQAARRPVVTERNGETVAVLAYSSVLPHSFWATENRAGCAPMRAFTVHEPVEHDQPGTPARIHTFPHREDLAGLCADIRKQKEAGHVVVVSLHWGIHFIPAVIADYQRDVAHAAIDAGADVILGHHSHILKGVEIYKGVPIFYSLANFAMDTRITPAHVATKGFQEIIALNPEWVPDFDSTFNFPPDSRMTIMARLRIESGRVVDTACTLGWINDNSQTEPLDAADDRFGDVLDYLRRITVDADLPTIYEVDGDLVRPRLRT